MNLRIVRQEAFIGEQRIVDHPRLEDVPLNLRATILIPTCILSLEIGSQAIPDKLYGRDICRVWKLLENGKCQIILLSQHVLYNTVFVLQDLRAAQ